MTRVLSLLIALGAGAGVAAQASDPWPKTVDEFRLAAQKVLDETGVPGAGPDARAVGGSRNAREPVRILVFAIDAWRRGAGPWLRAYAITVSLCACVLTAYLSYWGMIAFRPWAY